MNRNILNSTIILPFLLAVAALGDDPKDIQGWDKAKWGMTEEQLAQAFGEHAERHQKNQYATGYSTIRVKGFAFAGRDYRADMVFDNESGLLTAINLRAMDEKSLNVPEEFERLSGLLKKQYGSPTEQTATKVAWVFPSTTVRLEYKPATLWAGINIFGVYFRQNKTGNGGSPTTPPVPSPAPSAGELR